MLFLHLFFMLWQTGPLCSQLLRDLRERQIGIFLPDLLSALREVAEVAGEWLFGSVDVLHAFLVTLLPLGPASFPLDWLKGQSVAHIMPLSFILCPGPFLCKWLK